MIRTFLFLFAFGIIGTLSSQTIIDMETGKVRSKTTVDYQQESPALRYRATKDSITYQHLVVRALNALHTDSLQEAERLLNEAIALQPNAPSTATLFQLLGEIALVQERYALAVERLAKTLAHTPNNHRARYEKATAEIEIGSYQSAIDNCNVLLAASQSDFSAAQLHFLRGSAALRAQRYAMARSDFEQIVHTDPLFISATLLLVTTDRADGRIQQAADRLNLLLQQHPTLVEGLLMRAEFELEDKLYEAAIYDLSKAIEVAPNNAILYRKRAEALRALGQEKAAEKDLETARHLR